MIVVGEIYVRRDNFSVQELSQMLIAKGIYPKVTGVTEWIHYTDFARKFIMVGAPQARRLAAHAPRRRPQGRGGYQVEKRLEARRSREDRRASLEPTGLVPDVPHDMDEIIGEGQHEFVDPELESEATVSPAVGAAAMKDGYSGVAIIAPFGCLPGPPHRGGLRAVGQGPRLPGAGARERRSALPAERRRADGGLRAQRAALRIQWAFETDGVWLDAEPWTTLPSRLGRKLPWALSEMERHERKVARVAAQLRHRKSTAPLSRRKRVVSHQVPKVHDKRYSDDKIDLYDFDQVIEIDPERRICIAEPGVPFARAGRCRRSPSDSCPSSSPS